MIAALLRLTIAVDAYKGKISILLKNPKKNRSEIIEKLKFIEANKTLWNDYYFCAMVFAGMGDITASIEQQYKQDTA